jgi:hypothetical protein
MILYDPTIPVSLLEFGIQIPIRDSRATKTFEALCSEPNLGSHRNLWYRGRINETLNKEDLLRVHSTDYVDALYQALKPSGHLIISTFSLEGPPKCCKLNIVRYSAETLQKEFGDNFEMVETFNEVHDTPSKVQQNFIYCRFIKGT